MQEQVIKKKFVQKKWGNLRKHPVHKETPKTCRKMEKQHRNLIKNQKPMSFVLIQLLPPLLPHPGSEDFSLGWTAFQKKSFQKLGKGELQSRPTEEEQEKAPSILITAPSAKEKKCEFEKEAEKKIVPAVSVEVHEEEPEQPVAQRSWSW